MVVAGRDKIINLPLTCLHYMQDFIHFYGIKGEEIQLVIVKIKTVKEQLMQRVIYEFDFSEEHVFLTPRRSR